MHPDLTPEKIEALQREDVMTIQKLAKQLHESTPGVLDTPMSRADLERERDLRTAMKIKLEDCRKFLKQQIADHEAICGSLGIAKQYQAMDEKRLDSAAWSVPRTA